jgi:hypothetical protein
MLTLYGLEMLLGSDGVLENDILNAIRMVTVAIRIMAEVEFYRMYAPEAHGLSGAFVDYCRRDDVFGCHFVVMMIHLLEHMGPETARLGPLETISAFRFENTLKTLKDRTRSSKNPLKNITKKLKVQATFVSKASRTYASKHSMSRMLANGRYATLSTPKLYLSISPTSSANAYFSVENYICKFESVEKRDGQFIVHAYRYLMKDSAYVVNYRSCGADRTFRSSAVGVWKLQRLSPKLREIPVNLILKKYVVHKCDECVYAYEMISMAS